MGVSDPVIVPQQKFFLKSVNEAFIEPNSIEKIAILGAPKECRATAHIHREFPESKFDYYDILIENWDMNKEWKISGYDLVICHRVTPFVSDLQNFSTELEKCYNQNKHLIFDFSFFVSQIPGLDIQRTVAADGHLPLHENARFDFRNLFNAKKRADYSQYFRGGPWPRSHNAGWKQIDIQDFFAPRTYHEWEYDSFFTPEIENSFSTKDLSSIKCFPLAFVTSMNPFNFNCYITYMYFSKHVIEKSEDSGSIDDELWKVLDGQVTVEEHVAFSGDVSSNN